MHGELVRASHAITENPNVAIYYRNRAVVNYKLGNMIQAINDAKEALNRGDQRSRDLLLSMKDLLKDKEAEQTK